jgi:hypothetical protein
VNGKAWTNYREEWVALPGELGKATVVARYAGR